MELFDVPLFDDDFYKMLFRFGINTFFLTLIIWRLYYQNHHRKDFLFTYYMIGIITFFLCFTLKKYELDLGMALGLFAIFGIIRYRTDQIEIREMTYLFVVIGVSVINSLSNKNMSYAETLTANVLIVSFVAVLDHLKALKTEVNRKVDYDDLELIKPINNEKLILDLNEKLGLSINRVKILETSLKTNKSVLIIYYYRDEY